MNCYIVTFQPNSEASRAKIVEKLKSFAWYCPIHNYCWAIKTDKTAVSVREEVDSVMDASERIFVIKSGIEAAWRNTYGEKNSEWLKKNL